MGLESATYISDLVATNPVSGDPKSQGDDHIRLLKSTIKATFPNVNAAVTATDEELNYVDGVTSAIQTQLDAKAPIDSPTFTGTPAAPTATTGTSGNQIATLDYVIATALSSSLPGQTGNAGKLLSTDGTNGGWYDTIDADVVTLLSGGDLVGTTRTQELTNKTLVDPTLADNVDTTKKLAVDLANITTATTRTLTVVDENIKLFTGYAQYIGKVSASASATVEIELFVAEFDDYLIECNNLVHSFGSNSQLQMKIKKSGAYVSTGYAKQETDGVIKTAQSVFAMHTIATGSTQNHWFKLWFSRVNTTLAHSWRCEIANTTLAASDPVRGANSSSATALQGVQFLMSSGNITSGDFKVYGIRKI